MLFFIIVFIQSPVRFVKQRDQHDIDYHFVNNSTHDNVCTLGAISK